MSLDPITAALDLGGKLIDRLFPDPLKRDEAKLELLKLQQTGQLSEMAGQLDINKTEAASPVWFVAGWRPYIGWICGTGLAYQFIFMPIFNGVATMSSMTAGFPSLDMGTLLTLLLGMLGLGGMRTYEKITGAEGNR